MMVNFMCQLHWATRYPDIYSDIIFWMFLWGCFWIRFTFKLVDWVKQVSLRWVSLIQSIESLNRIKKPDPSQEKENSSCLNAFVIVCHFSPVFRLKLKHGLFFNLWSAGLLTGTTLWVSRLPTHPKHQI